MPTLPTSACKFWHALHTSLDAPQRTPLFDHAAYTTPTRARDASLLLQALYLDDVSPDASLVDTLNTLYTSYTFCVHRITGILQPDHEAELDAWQLLTQSPWSSLTLALYGTNAADGDEISRYGFFSFASFQAHLGYGVCLTTNLFRALDASRAAIAACGSKLDVVAAAVLCGETAAGPGNRFDFGEGRKGRRVCTRVARNGCDLCVESHLQVLPLFRVQGVACRGR